jgi:hypothetical protein
VNRALGADFVRLFATRAVRQRLRALDVPMLLVHGDADPRPAAAVQALASELPQSRLVVLDGVAHFPYWEAPERLEQLLRTFLTAPSPPLTAEDRAAVGRVARGFVPEAGSVEKASPDVPCPRGRDDPTGSRQP